MPEKLTRDQYAEQVTTTFRVLDDPETPVDLTLVEVTERRATRRQEMFSLFFGGPLDHFMPQSIHRLEHPRLGVQELFLVPVGQQPDKFIYEAVFNRLIEPTPDTTHRLS
jgi:hypothetical protein